jgi:hypothetical protein
MSDERDALLARCRAMIEEAKRPGMYTPSDMDAWREQYYGSCGPKTLAKLLDWIDELRAVARI